MELQSPGLVVMGGDSRSRGRGFESWYRILDGHFFQRTLIYFVRGNITLTSCLTGLDSAVLSN